MSTLMMVGVNHKTAPVAVRDQVAFTAQEIPSILATTKDQTFAKELVLLSTCNRTEFYGLMSDPQSVLKAWQNARGFESDLIASHHYQCENAQVVRHLMRVASGLDSMVLGEPQILSQLKMAYDIAHKQSSMGMHLQRLFQKSFMVAKAVRTQTAIGSHPVSIAYAAVKLAQHIFTDLKKAKVLLIGSGETIELVGRHLKAQGVQNETYANRSLARAQLLATHLDAHAMPLSDLDEKLGEFDIVISAVGAQAPILKAEKVERALKKHKRHPVFMVDLGMPRNIDEAVKAHDDVYLYNLDDLQAIIQNNLETRQQEAFLAETIIDSHAQAFMDWLEAKEAIQLVKGMRARVTLTKEALIEQAHRALETGQDPKKVVECLAHRLTQKLLHHPSRRLKQAGAQKEAQLLEAASELFNLE